ncbi:MAG: 4Fe-4S dicluster domain-containing protein [Chloroflexi bacterium]|nr:4Fe-4S dicluster domain-containing protein [Chloroflexota bacterium]
MPEPILQVGGRAVVERRELPALFSALQRRGYRVAGPTVRDGAIAYDELASPADLPVGWTDEQDGGRYRLKRRQDEAVFGYGVGQHSWKQFLHPSVLRLWRARRDGGETRFEMAVAEPPKRAFVGVRSCDLHAIAIQDKIFTEGPYVDPFYRARRENSFVVAVNCGYATPGTCFCVSMGTGPRATLGFDLALTEILEAGRHDFVVDVGTDAGAAVLRDVPHRPAQPEDLESAERVVSETAAHMGRTLETAGIKDLLYANLDHPRWDQVIRRCLTCGNCTMVCPTCFCFTVEEVTDVTGAVVERVRRMDVCFTTEFTYTAGKPIRQSARSRYRQWLTHKLGIWIDQFGMSGCVGCGRCITWCPVGIDITEEAAAIRATDRRRESAP